MKKALATLVAAIAVGQPAAWAQDRQADAPLVVNGNLSLTTRDFMAYIERIPVGRRDEFRAGIERITKTVDGLWVQRMMATKARAAGLDQDPLVVSRQNQAQEAVLADAYLARLARDFEYPKTLEARAVEIYKAKKQDYILPEEVHVQHVLVGPNWRTEAMALELAKEIRAKAVAGKEDFLDLARRYSDDSSVKKNSGDLGSVSPGSFVKPFADAVAKMKTAGEISQPVRTSFGYHVIRFVGRKPAKQLSYESVKESIIAAEKDKLLDEARNTAITAVRADPGNHLYLENVEALRVEVKARDVKTSKADAEPSPQR